MKRYVPNEAALAGFQDLIQQIDAWTRERLSKSRSEDGKQRYSIEQDPSVASFNAVRCDLLRIMGGNATEDEVRAFCQRMELRTQEVDRQTKETQQFTAYLRGQRQLYELGTREDELVTVQ